jgi:hypothetical protein
LSQLHYPSQFQRLDGQDETKLEHRLAAKLLKRAIGKGFNDGTLLYADNFRMIIDDLNRTTTEQLGPGTRSENAGNMRICE